MRVFSLLLIFSLATSVMAAVPYTPNSDLVLSGRVVFQTQPTVGEYQLVLSAIKKVNNQWRAKQEFKSHALISRLTVELDERIPFTDARRKLEEDMEKAQNFTVLFQCFGLDCGSSNGWANEFLRVKQLYGLDTSQFYAVQVGLDSQRRETYVVWYLVRRGNGRTYLQQDVIHAGPDAGVGKSFAPDVWWELLSDKGYFVLPGFALAGDEVTVSGESIDLLASLLDAHPKATVRIVGHDYRAGAFAERERRSQFYAQKVRDLLVAKGVAASRLSVHGLGHLAPAGKVEPARVEIVLD